MVASKINLLIAFQKCDGNTYIQRLLTSWATTRDSMPHTKVLGNYSSHGMITEWLQVLIEDVLTAVCHSPAIGLMNLLTFP